ncbi:enoyl-CoA hydratase/isomerase [Schizothecium vesticola]|uniref:Enoyl-CoA hydratase domain-containing protein 3, mitochondrial n=1 Tax=Schizothecium vesticola TaxID=314040 RepID=A0AA40EJ94_9PEZI|nr:enoyl-CoA hydratase/isomerase [Schizothecium vesticola]
MASFPKLPARAAYLHLANPSRRNALSLTVIRDLTSQLRQHLTSPSTGHLLTLPTFQPSLLREIESGQNQQYRWLIDASEWHRQRNGLPNVLVLRSEGPVFSSGHNLKEVASMNQEECKTLFDACAELMSLIRRSPVVVVSAVQGLATAAGAQLALTCDIAIARGSTQFQLPGMTIGLPCTSPSTAVSRRLPRSLAYRMFATAQPVRADRLAGAVDTDFVDSDETWEARIEATVNQLVSMPGQPQAFGKWAFWTQAGIGTGGTGGDGYEEAVRWTSTAMAMHARGGEAKEGIVAFLDKRMPEWTT